MAKQVFGGECRFTLSSGEALTVRGSVTIYPSNMEIEPIINQNGAVSGSATLTGYEAEWTFEDPPGDLWTQLMRARSFNCSLVEEYAGRRHVWTDAMFVGRPSIDRMTGEVSGVRTVAQTYVKKAA